ncbi:hydantoinase B/oxoprolinase family protein [Kushneria indalinina]|uniref:N-methylhydantoinase B n=1 Tax=Kushneria indalinina DSM 14324 TaxID=1122140 RepID=A0A3D9DSR6_9GAMM|nr:hydantoinase B/oxoprolinase family protein [Kushneria indalinina]REC93820.1 N-methylhydantoinase B [Kushneria indalinina DSM 14324]
MAFDNTVVQIFANYCVAAAESMAYTLVRTAHSTFIKETEDFSCALITPEGLAFASPRTLGATWYIGLDYGPVLSRIEDYRPGDIAMTNDPYSGSVATHTPDIVMWKPVFYQGMLICFVGGHIHNTDMGGAVPASLSRTLTEIEQEGIRFPPVKIVREGVLDESLLDIMAANVRVPKQNRGDLMAQIAMLHNGEKRVLEIIERFGTADFCTGMDALLDYAERQARQVIATVPDGDYFFAEYADEDSVAGKPMRLALNLQIRGEEAILDYTGSDPQLASSLNMPTGGMVRHALALVGYHYVLYTLQDDILLNAGLDRPVRCVLPEGSVVNAVAPAAVGMRSLTCKLTHVLTFGAFSRAIPERLPACAAAGLAIMSVKTMDSDGRTLMASLGPVGGGAGGMPFGDGSDGSGANVAFLRNTPVEINEAEVPILMHRYCLVPDSGGPGRYRGGLGLCMEFQVFSPGTMVTARNRDRTHFASWGILGGQAGATARFTRNPEADHAEALGNTDIVHCQPGDVIRLVGCGAGGYGDPLDRLSEEVLRDVRCGYVSPERARTDYGVVLDHDRVSEEKTQALRRSMRDQSRVLPDAPFAYGPYRDAFETRWTRERYAALTDILASLPVAWRFFIKHQLFDGLAARYDKGEVVEGAAVIHELFEQLMKRYPALSPQRDSA